MSLQSTPEHLKGLPVFDEMNFSRFQAEGCRNSSSKKPSVYLPTKDHPSEQSMPSTVQSLGSID